MYAFLNLCLGLIGGFALGFIVGAVAAWRIGNSD
jgi:hypothetical protein